MLSSLSALRFVVSALAPPHGMQSVPAIGGSSGYERGLKGVMVLALVVVIKIAVAGAAAGAGIGLVGASGRIEKAALASASSGSDRDEGGCGGTLCTGESGATLSSVVSAVSGGGNTKSLQA